MQTLVDQRLYARTGRTAVTELEGVTVIRLDGAKDKEAQTKLGGVRTNGLKRKIL